MKHSRFFFAALLPLALLSCLSVLRGADRTLSWNGNNAPSPTLEYVVEQKGAGDTWTIVRVVPSSESSAAAPHATQTVVQLSPGTYVFRIRARLTSGELSAPSNEAGTSIVPNAPTGFLIAEFLIVVPNPLTT